MGGVEPDLTLAASQFPPEAWIAALVLIIVVVLISYWLI